MDLLYFVINFHFSYSPIVLDLTSIAKDGEQEGNLINVRTEDLIRLVSQAGKQRNKSNRHQSQNNYSVV